ncbi:MAG: hypothetical protein IJB70_02260 [Clostridia bacterium]|nr:hypothetical protein [Clostridia bacterium]
MFKKKTFNALMINILPILLVCALIIPRTDTKNAASVISSDYSTITYNNETYVPVQLTELPPEVVRIISNLHATSHPSVIASLKATVENDNYFLDKYFWTNQITVFDIDGEKFIYLNTDYDANESDYYCTKSYYNRVIE